MPPGLQLVAGCGEQTLSSSSQSPAAVVHQETAAATAGAEPAPPHQAVCGAAPLQCDHQSPSGGCQRQLGQALGRQDGQLAAGYGAALWPETEG